MPGALQDVVVAEFACGVAGPYAGKLLAELGAQVIKCEPPGGDRLRFEPPLVAGESAFFAWMNAAKQFADVPHGSDAEALLLAHADIVVHDLQGPEADAFDARARQANPRAIVMSLTPFGRSGPIANWQATPLVEWALSGFQYIAGDPNREPVSLPGFQAEFHAGLHAAVGSLGALWYARETGAGQAVELSHQEATLSDHAWVTTSWSHQGRVQMRPGSPFVPCADGFIYIFNLVPYPNLFILMERFDLLEDESLQDPLVYRTRFASEIIPAITKWAATRTKQEIYHACQELRIAASPVNDMRDVADNAQLAARKWFTTVTAGRRSFQAPGVPYRLSATPAKSTPARDTCIDAAFPWANGTLPAPSRQPKASELPLEGIRVIEMTANWAGPAAGRQLADMGADVIKIELATKPATRTLVWVPEDLWPDHYNRSAYFNKLNRNKRAICLDVSKPGGKEVFFELLQHADVLLENNAARVMANLGLDYASLAARKPGIIMCSISGYGATGPERNYSAYGSNSETVSGLASLLGYGPGEYFGTGSYYADPVSGNHGAVAILAALNHRRTTGEGQWIDISLLEAVTPFFAQQLLEYTVTGVVPGPRANDAWGNLLEGAVPTFGVDCWLSVTIRDAADRARLDAVTGATGDSWEALRTWASERDHQSAASVLQAAGIPAAPVLKGWELVSNNHLNDRGFFVPTRHEVMGTFPYPGFPWRFEQTPLRTRRASPMFAEHNSTVFRDLLGMDDTRIQQLYAADITRDSPEFAAGSL